jgi:redox-sensitive bicupin YhaK (pirin superfamily)
MITLRPSAARGHFDFGWLDTRHSFSFGDYYDPRHMGFRALRVINEDRVKPGAGFPTHPHRDMEIVTYVLDGALEHKDSLGSGSVIRPGEVQRMTAGTGVTHSEFNPSEFEPVHFLQIWILPERRGLAPGYEQKALERGNGGAPLRLVASPDGAEGSVTVHQDARLYAASLDAGRSALHRLSAGRHAWVQIARGEIKLNGITLRTGDGVAVSDEPVLRLESLNDSELLLFDLA